LNGTLQGRLAGLGLIAVVLAALPGCSELIDPFDYAEVEVSAELRTGVPVEGVHLVLYMGTRVLEHAETGPDGRHVHRFVPHGDVGLFAFPPSGFLHLESALQGEPITFRVREGDRREVSYTLLHWDRGSVRVLARDPDGAGIEGVSLRILRVWPGNVEPVDLQGETGPDGVHLFTDVDFGRYRLEVLPGEGYVVPPGGVTVEGLLVDAGYEETAEVTLERSGGDAAPLR
jgi:hypothetical protein